MEEVMPICIVPPTDGVKERMQYFSDVESDISMVKSGKDPFYQLEGFQLFAYFTANIIKEDVIFTR